MQRRNIKNYLFIKSLTPSARRMGKSYISRYILIAATALLASCSAYNDPENYGILTDYAIAAKYEGNGIVDYFFERDDGAILLINNSTPSEEVADGQRVKLYYQIDGESGGSESRMTIVNTKKVYNITLYAMVKVPVREPLSMSTLTPEESRRLGDDPLEQVTRLFFSGGYLNLEYRISANNEDGFHDLNLVIEDALIHAEEETDEEAGEELTLYIRYNNDASGSQAISSNLTDQEYAVSFDITRLIPEEQTTLKINFIWREPGRIATKSGTYTLDRSSYNPIVGSAGKVKATEIPGLRK